MEENLVKSLVYVPKGFNLNKNGIVILRVLEYHELELFIPRTYFSSFLDEKGAKKLTILYNNSGGKFVPAYCCFNGKDYEFYLSSIDGQYQKLYPLYQNHKKRSKNNIENFSLEKLKEYVTKLLEKYNEPEKRKEEIDKIEKALKIIEENLKKDNYYNNVKLLNFDRIKELVEKTEILYFYS